MKGDTIKTMLAAALFAAGAGGGAGCKAESPGGAAAAGAAADAAPAGAARGGRSPAPTPALRIEQASRKLDVGRDVALARAELEAVLLDPAATREERDNASLALSRALEAQGDREGAVEALEKLMASHLDERHWPLEQLTRETLHKLLTGRELRPEPRFFVSDDLSPLARSLAGYFPERARGQFEVKLLRFGAQPKIGSNVHPQLLGESVQAAILDSRREACGDCDVSADVSTVVAQATWHSIGAYKGRLDEWLTIFEFDLGDGRIPPRYDAQLPMPSAEIAAHLERGRGVIVARERPGAPPAVVLAAPRRTSLNEVWFAFLRMSALPAEPAFVDLRPGLGPDEFLPVVAGARKAQQRCFDELPPASRPAAGMAGVILKVTVDADGKVSDVGPEEPTPLPNFARAGALPQPKTIRDPAFERCVSDAVRPLVFPATGEPTSFTIPVMLGQAPPATLPKAR
jgi:hypothetical protein